MRLVCFLAPLLLARSLAFRISGTGKALATEVSGRDVDADQQVSAMEASEQMPPPQQLRVLTYNVCWGCVTASTANRSGFANDLRKYCTAAGKGLTKCAHNMASAVAQYSKNIGGYDLIAMQEASSYDFLDLLTAKMKVANQGFYKTVKQGGLVCAYNAKRFKWPDVKIFGTGSTLSKRPEFLVLVFDKQKLIFINLHNDQQLDPKKKTKPSWTSFPYDIQRALQKDAFMQNAARRSYRVVLAGDFNDIHGKFPGGIKFPWLPKPLELGNGWAKSCCSTVLTHVPQRSGDYIFDSAARATNRLPASYNMNLAQSDHRPVEAVLGGGGGGAGAAPLPLAASNANAVQRQRQRRASASAAPKTAASPLPRAASGALPAKPRARSTGALPARGQGQGVAGQGLGAGEQQTPAAAAKTTAWTPKAKTKANVTQKSGPTASFSQGGAASKHADSDLRVLTYNVCWGCLAANPHDAPGFADDLKAQCQKSKASSLTNCAENMADSIAKYSDAIGGYDLVSFQEASYGEFSKMVQRRLRAGGQRTNFVTNGGLVTLYNVATMGEPDLHAFGRVPTNHPSVFQVLVFDKTRLIVVNVHLGFVFNETLSGKSGFVEPLRQVLQREAFERKAERSKYRVVMTGDFSDKRGQLPGHVKLPWLQSTSPALGIETPFPRSCCSSFLKQDPGGHGSYIFDSNSVNVTNQIPGLYDKFLPQSDHRPTEAVLRGRSSSPSSRGATTPGSAILPPLLMAERQ